MHYILFLLVALSCSSEKKLRKGFIPVPDTDGRITHDWNRDGFPETVLILPARPAEQYRELVIYRGVSEGTPREVIASNRNLIPRRARPGGTLRLQKDFSFTLSVDSSGSSRIGEIKTWRFSWRKDRFLLTGMTHEWSDKLDPNDYRNCSVDLKRGRGMKNGKLMKFPPDTIELTDLNEKFLPAICEF